MVSLFGCLLPAPPGPWALGHLHINTHACAGQCRLSPQTWSLTGMDVNFYIGCGTINYAGRGQGSPGSGAVPEMTRVPRLTWWVGLGSEVWNREGDWMVSLQESQVLGEGNPTGGNQDSVVMGTVTARMLGLSEHGTLVTVSVKSPPLKFYLLLLTNPCSPLNPGAPQDPTLCKWFSLLSVPDLVTQGYFPMPARLTALHLFTWLSPRVCSQHPIHVRS